MQNSPDTLRVLLAGFASMASNTAPKSTLLDLLDFRPVGLGSRIRRLYLSRRVRPPSNECPRYDTKLYLMGLHF